MRELGTWVAQIRAASGGGNWARSGAHQRTAAASDIPKRPKRSDHRELLRMATRLDQPRALLTEPYGARKGSPCCFQVACGIRRLPGCARCTGAAFGHDSCACAMERPARCSFPPFWPPLPPLTHIDPTFDLTEHLVGVQGTGRLALRCDAVPARRQTDIRRFAGDLQTSISVQWCKRTLKNYEVAGSSPGAGVATSAYLLANDGFRSKGHSPHRHVIN